MDLEKQLYPKVLISFFIITWAIIILEWAWIIGGAMYLKVFS